MPTIDNSEQACQAMEAFIRAYPGKLVFAIVANGTSESHLRRLRAFQSRHLDCVLLEALAENRGYGQGCNLGLKTLSERGGINLFGVTNDDVLPASACLTEMAAAFRELEVLGHRPGLVGPITNNINGPQQRSIGDYASPDQMEALAKAWHGTNHESVTQALQLRGLFLLIHPELLSEIGGFDARFGIGNFEDDDYNLRARLAGFTLWIADGAFLHHYGSATFRHLQIDYQANIDRNAESFLRKWRLQRLEDWLALDAPPSETSLHCPLDSKPLGAGFQIKVNGETVDLIEQASDIEFAAWVMGALSHCPRKDREAVIQCVKALAEAA